MHYEGAPLQKHVFCCHCCDSTVKCSQRAIPFSGHVALLSPTNQMHEAAASAGLPLTAAGEAVEAGEAEEAEEAVEAVESEAVWGRVHFDSIYKSFRASSRVPAYGFTCIDIVFMYSQMVPYVSTSDMRRFTLSTC